jgi:diacylglycerol kinase (ATP)
VRPAVVVNGHAGAGAALRAWPRVGRLLRDRLGDVEFCFTEGPGHGALLAHKLASAGFNPVLAAGGDGTMNEVVNGILSSGRELATGMIPLASGGDFARTLEVSDWREAIEVVAAGHVRVIDTAVARFARGTETPERHYVNAASIGIGAEVAASLTGWCRFLPVSARYLAVAVQKVATGRGFDLRLWLDDREPLEFHASTVAVANGRYQGGGICIAPDARIADGVLDITVIEYVTLAELAVSVRLLYSGEIYTHPKVHHWRARRVRAESNTGAPVELDGEAVGALAAEFEVTPGSLRLLCPPSA